MPDRISEEAKKLFALDSKIALVAVKDDEGYPHITMLSTLMAKDDKSLMFGRFCEGLSKQFIQQRPKAGFMLMSVDKELWRGRAIYTHTETVGPEFDIMNSKPLFRYNTYFGISRVFYLDLVDISDKDALPMGAVISNALLTRLRKGAARGHDNGALNRLSRNLVDGIATLKFIAAEDDEGFCRITPIVQAASASTGRLAFTGKPYADELARIKPGQKASVFVMNLSLESVLFKGVYGADRGLFMLDIDKVYNPLMPVPGYVYPKAPLQAVTEFV